MNETENHELGELLAGVGWNRVLDLTLFDIELGIICHCYRENYATENDENEKQRD